MLSYAPNRKAFARSLRLIAWCAANPNVSTVITGASNVEQVAENMGALDVIDRLTPEVLVRIDEIVA